LKDEKNLEYQDKMYYEMAKFELKQNNVDEGIKLLKKSIEVGEKPIQKAYSYLKIGEVYYEKVKNYRTAANYYDSCLVHLPKNNLQYNYH
jgi:tetratricopeptide (TPR) repeat protein